MNLQQAKQMINRANALFPFADYTQKSAVRHARRQWLQSANYLRSRQLWILDRKVERVN